MITTVHHSFDNALGESNEDASGDVCDFSSTEPRVTDEMVKDPTGEMSSAGTPPIVADFDDRPAGTVDELSLYRRLPWISIFVVLCVFVAINLPYRYSVYHSQTTGKLTEVVDFEVQGSEMPVMAGAPYRYLINYDSGDGTMGSEISGAGRQKFSGQALLYNVMLALAVMVVVVLYRLRGMRVRKSGRKKSVSISDLLVLTLVIAGPFAYWRHLEAEFDSKLTFYRSIGTAGGGVSLKSWGPAWCEPWVPKYVAQRFSHFDAVRLDKADAALLDQVLDRPMLSVLRTGGTPLPESGAARIAAMPHLADLRLSGMVLTGSAFKMLGSVPTLHTLNLMRTNVDKDAIGHFGANSALKRFGCIHSDLALADVGDCGLGDTLVQLNVGHPGPGETDTLSIAGWPVLEKLSMAEFEGQPNSTPVKIRLTDLPMLRTLVTDVFQKVDLEISNVPRFDELRTWSFEWFSRLSKGGRVAGTMWPSRVVIDDAPKLAQFDFFCVDLEEFKVTRTPSLKTVGIGANYLVQNPAFSSLPELETDVGRALVEGIGQSDGPEIVDLDSVPLKGIDLAPLANNSRIRELRLAKTQTNLKQWKSLAPMKGLTKISLGKTRLMVTALNSSLTRSRTWNRFRVRLVRNMTK